ncbi:Metallo-hydrolase/oxidoreductase [Auricularia subglabra TFB-10046 SS5]|nr:Metallo-hydrolase/oxidoreductase [Auricularia subglabra TFB-10046 SS5]
MPPLSLTFLGTCSGGGPTLSRNCSSIALNLAGESWLIDCAEGTQLQMQRLNGPTPGRITRIFITHMHVDHVFGLVPLMGNIMFALRNPPPAHLVRLIIYGPAGLRSFVRSNLKATSMVLAGKYQVHELLTATDVQTSCLPEELHQNEMAGQDIRPGPDGTWSNFALTSGMAISAGQMQHRITSLGYVFQEEDRPDTSPEWLAYLDKIPLHLLPTDTHIARQLIPRFSAGEPVLLEDGTPVLPPSTMIPGRKLVILGDTSDASGIADLACDADVLVHEATNAPVKRERAGWGVKSEAEVSTTARSRGHSTPRMAGRFAKGINAKTLVLNHFSSMFLGPPPSAYKGAGARERESVLEQIRAQAAETFGSANVVTAHDGLVLDVAAREAVRAGTPTAAKEGAPSSNDASVNEMTR